MQIILNFNREELVKEEVTCGFILGSQAMEE